MTDPIAEDMNEMSGGTDSWLNGQISQSRKVPNEHRLDLFPN